MGDKCSIICTCQEKGGLTPFCPHCLTSHWPVLLPHPTNHPLPLSWPSFPSAPPRTHNRTQTRVRGSIKLPGPAETPHPQPLLLPFPLNPASEGCPQCRSLQRGPQVSTPTSYLSASASSAPWSCGQPTARLPPCPALAWPVAPGCDPGSRGTLDRSATW